MQLCSSSARAQRLAALAFDQARQHVDLGIAGLGAAARDQALEVEQELAHRAVAELELLGA